jgi:integrase/recombinase XerD
MLELMARGGMRVGEVLNLTPGDIQERTLAIQNPKSGRARETVYVRRKILVRLTGYVRAQDIDKKDRIFSHFLCCRLVYGEKIGKNG